MEKIDWVLMSCSLYLIQVFFQYYIKKNKSILASSGIIPFIVFLGTQKTEVFNSSFTIFKFSISLLFILFIINRLLNNKLKADYSVIVNIFLSILTVALFISSVQIPLLIINVLLILTATFVISLKLFDYTLSHSKFDKENMEIGFISFIGSLSLGLGNSGFYLYMGILILITFQLTELALDLKRYSEEQGQFGIRLKDLEDRFERTVEYEAKKRTAVMADKVEYIREKSQKDPLTKAYNRNGIVNELNGLINDSSIKIFSVAMFDIDFFKSINDTKGHAIGDECLKFLSYSFMTSNRKTDLLGRYGGDEFILLMPHINAPAAMEICDRLRKEIVQKSNPKFSISMGIASYPFDGRSFSELLECSDKGLYHAKETGRNRVSYVGKVPMLKK